MDLKLLFDSRDSKHILIRTLFSGYVVCPFFNPYFGGESLCFFLPVSEKILLHR